MRVPFDAIVAGLGIPTRDFGRLLFAAGSDESGGGRRRDWQDEDRESTPCPDPIELVLYVSRHSAHSAQAVKNIKGVLARFKSTQVKLTVCDLSAEPSQGEKDNITFTPTLVRNGPGPRTFILGHISNPELVLELLADCEEI